MMRLVKVPIWIQWTVLNQDLKKLMKFTGFEGAGPEPANDQAKNHLMLFIIITLR